MSIIKTETNQDVSHHRRSDDTENYKYFNCPNCKTLNKFRIKDVDGRLDVKVADDAYIGDNKTSIDEKDKNDRIDKISESNNKNIELFKKYCILSTRKTSSIKT